MFTKAEELNKGDQEWNCNVPAIELLPFVRYLNNYSNHNEIATNSTINEIDISPASMTLPISNCT